MGLSLLLEWFLVSLTVWVLWRSVLQRLIFKSPLDNLRGPPVASFFSGNLAQFLSRHSWDFQLDVAQNYGPVVNIRGFLGEPTLYVYDPKALHSIIIKDQYIYEESPMFIQINRLSFGHSLLGTLGDHHKKQRKMLNPVFSMAHMRHMVPIFYEVTYRLRTALVSRVANGPGELDMLDWMGRTALELIGKGGLGYSFDPLVEDTSDEYSTAMKALLPTISSFGVWRLFLPYFAGKGTPAFWRSIVEMLPSKRVQKYKEIVDLMHRRSVEIFQGKKAALEKGNEAFAEQIGEGKDIMSILIRANMEAKSDEDRLPDHELIAQVSTFCFAATDTTSNTLSRILQLLAEHPDLQEKLRDELVQAQKSGELSYDDLMALPYLDAVCRETLRVHPPVTTLMRQSTKDMVMPLSEPIRGVNGKVMTEVPVPKGTRIFVGIAGWNLNKAVWGEDALEWKPERWLSPLPAPVTEAHIPGVYSNIMSFLGGGRACIGFKFSEMEMKVVLAVLLPIFTFGLTEKPIVWNMAGVRYPSVGKESTVAEMPLKVGLYTKSSGGA